ncbi:MAG: helix-turn-helix domain-containing protein [Clostridia bacterium]|nr:helix-turn-helix domain-containing protein [Clostridia bacterium]
MNTIFADLPDVLDAKTLAQALSISKSSAYALMNLEDFPTLQLGARKLVTKPDLIAWMSRHIRDGSAVNDPPEKTT